MKQLQIGLSREAAYTMFLGSIHFSPYSGTLLSGLLAVLSVNVVIAFYIFIALREPSDKHEPDPKFLVEAKASVKQRKQNEAENSASTRFGEHVGVNIYVAKVKAAYAREIGRYKTESSRRMNTNYLAKVT
ncbi:hypothetical protein RJ640_004517 [Escallonia rubra]|uniref:Uncharacterized protein n=1 Tax=Escallonia rubra TaxID=112253 RepID=A0AA88S004_9ASTE|nr:hypothetical protein RJ640_004517 [Escallonia rubra]